MPIQRGLLKAQADGSALKQCCGIESVDRQLHDLMLVHLFFFVRTTHHFSYTFGHINKPIVPDAV